MVLFMTGLGERSHLRSSEEWNEQKQSPPFQKNLPSIKIEPKIVSETALHRGLLCFLLFFLLSRSFCTKVDLSWLIIRLHASIVCCTYTC